MLYRLLTVSLVIFHTIFLFGQSNTLGTSTEPVVILGEELPELSGIEKSELFLYAYSGSTWQIIPFQIDERHSNGRFTVEDDIPGLDANDEIVFMARDAGDSAEESWIANAESQAYSRYEFRVTSTDGSEAWVYLYRIPSHQESSSVDYVDYIPAPNNSVTDTVLANGVYKVGAAANGFPEFLGVYDGGTGVDILQRHKIEIEATLNIGFPVTARLNDANSFFATGVSYNDGKVRVIRELRADIKIVLTDTVDVFSGLVFPIFYYGRHYEIKPPELEITREILQGLPVPGTITRIEQDFILNENAAGLRFFNAYNSNVVIDGTDDDVETSIVLEEVGVNRFLFKGSQAHFISEYTVPDIGDSQSLVYLDDSDEDVFGSTGFKVVGDTVLGKVPFGHRVVFPGVVADGNEAEYTSTDIKGLSTETQAQDYGEVTTVNATTDTYIPQEFRLAQNYPNPFNPSTLINYSVPTQSNVTITVYNLLGQKITTLVNKEHLQGNHSVVWNGRDQFGYEVAAGVYIYKLKAEGFVQTRKMLLIK